MLTTYSKSKLMLMLYNNLASKLYHAETSTEIRMAMLISMATLVASPDFPQHVEAMQLGPDAKLYEHDIFAK